MTSITAAMVKKLREETSLGMMDCKKALVEAEGDSVKAVELLRISGALKAGGRSDRAVSEGIVCLETCGENRSVAMVRLGCETDFVARSDDFVDFAESVAVICLDNKTSEINVDDSIVEISAKVGEHVTLNGIAYCERNANEIIHSYNHHNRIGVIVFLDAEEGRNEEIQEHALNIAMHIAATNPEYLDESDIPQEALDSEKNILIAEAEASGKPSNIIEKMVMGRIKKHIASVTLLGQPFIKDSDITVGQYVERNNIKLNKFIRFQVGDS